jgi:hypothetical protein
MLARNPSDVMWMWMGLQVILATGTLTLASPPVWWVFLLRWRIQNIR